jgi:catechol 2,3-dioxygenase-like lactoylglutathione lyase family enzyme
VKETAVDEAVVSVGYMVDDVQAAIGFYTAQPGFTLRSSAVAASADVTRGNLRLRLAGPSSSAGRPMPDGRRPAPGGWNRIHLVVPGIAAEGARLRSAWITFLDDIVTGPGGQQVLSEGPAGNRIGLFAPAAR